MTVFFDMDGTIADLYGVEDWLYYLESEVTLPYAIAKPLVRFSLLARYIHKLQSAGIHVGVISWTSKNGSPEYNRKVAQVKKEWLVSHLPSVAFDFIHVIDYGTPKSRFATDGDILFDDEYRNRAEWENVPDSRAFDEKEIFEILKKIIKGA